MCIFFMAVNFVGLLSFVRWSAARNCARHDPTRRVSSSLATGLSMGPPAGHGAELQFAFAPFHAPELAGLNLVFQILCGLEQRAFEGVVSGLGVQARATNQPRSLTCMTAGA